MYVNDCRNRSLPNGLQGLLGGGKGPRGGDGPAERVGHRDGHPPGPLLWAGLTRDVPLWSTHAVAGLARAGSSKSRKCRC